MIGLDMVHGQTLSGQQIDNMTDHQLKAMVNSVSVFYRVTPRHKLTIIKVITNYILYCCKISIVSNYVIVIDCHQPLIL